MAKKEEAVESKEEVALVVAVAVAEDNKSTRASNLVTMQDGSVIDFSNRKAIITTDEVTGAVNFKVVNGTIIDWTIPEVAALAKGIELASAEFDTTVLSKIGVKSYIIALVDRIRAVINALKTGDELVAAINKQIEAINSGIFVTRPGSSSKSGGLPEKVRIWAYANWMTSPEEFAAWEVVKEVEVPQDVINSINEKWALTTPMYKQKMNEAVAAYVNAKFQLASFGTIEWDLTSGL